MTMTSLFLFILGLSAVYCDSHFLRYYHTAVSSLESGMPLYSEFGLLDDRLIESYNSDTQQYLPKAEWMKKLGPEYWKRELQRSRRSEPVFRHRVMTLMKRFNQTGGFHIVQRMYGCELRDDGSTMGYNQHRYDGRDFIYLDTQRWIWVPAMYEAQITTQRWNSPEEKVGELWKNYLQNQCIEDLKQFIEYGREDVEKKVRPEVKVWGRRHSNGVTKLQCLVYGFHPRAVDVKWVRNGVDHLPSDEMSPILPHPDGTYQIRVTAEVPTKEGDTYSCHVDHSSLEEILTEKWNPSTYVNIPLIIGIVFVVLVIIAIIGVIGIIHKS